MLDNRDHEKGGRGEGQLTLAVDPDLGNLPKDLSTRKDLDRSLGLSYDVALLISGIQTAATEGSTLQMNSEFLDRSLHYC